MKNIINLVNNDDNTKKKGSRGARVVYSHCEIKDLNGTWFLDIYGDFTFILKYQKLSTMTESFWKKTVASGRIKNGQALLDNPIDKKEFPTDALKSIQQILHLLLNCSEIVPLEKKNET